MYSVIPTMFDDSGQEMQLLEFEDVNELIGKTMNVKLSIHEAQGLPEILSTEVFADYKWIDE